MAASAITVEQLTDAIQKEWPAAQIVEKSAYHRVSLADPKCTLGYIYIRGQRPAAEVMNGDGKYTYFSIKTKADLTKTIAAMRKVEAKAKKASK